MRLECGCSSSRLSHPHHAAEVCIVASPTSLVHLPNSGAKSVAADRIHVSRILKYVYVVVGSTGYKFQELSFLALVVL